MSTNKVVYFVHRRKIGNRHKNVGSEREGEQPKTLRAYGGRSHHDGGHSALI